MTVPRVSILLPVRNGEAALGHALRSCLAQTFGDFELIVVDDQSSDATASIIQEIAKDDARVIPATTEAPGGIVPALLKAVDLARGEFLARMDADDGCRPERLAVQVRFLDEHPEIALCGCRVKIGGNGQCDERGDGSRGKGAHESGDRSRGEGADGRVDRPADGFARYETWINDLLTPHRIAAERFVESPLVHPSVMMRREAYAAAGGYRDTEWAEDYDLWLRMLERGMRLAKVPELLLDWNDPPGRLTRVSSRYSLERFLEAKAHYLTRMPEVARRGVSIGAAGPIGKSMARYLQAGGARVHAFIEVNPRRIGKRIHGVPVIASDDLEAASPDAPILLAAVGQPGGRDKLRELFTSLGYVEGKSFFCVC